MHQFILAGLPLSIDIGSSVGALTGVLVILVLVLIAACSSAAETAFFSLTPAQLNEIRSSKSGINRRIARLLENPKLLLATILITNNLVNVGTVIISTFLINRYLDFSFSPLLAFIIQVIVITSILMLIGEIMPKIVANQKPVRVVGILASPLALMERILYPFSIILVNSTNFIDKRQTVHSPITLDDISNAIDITSDGKVDEDDRKIMKSITRFSETYAREIMTPRVDCTTLDKSLSFSRVQQIILESGYSRIPVYDETPDSITGILYIKDLLPHLVEDDTFAWVSLVRPPFFVPENKPVNDLLKEFQEKKIHMAVVVDEYGGTSGIITLEDIIEEIVGEINDEFDTESGLFIRIDEQTFLFEGKISINDLCDALQIDDRIFDEVKGTSESLGGLLQELSGKMPQAGEKIIFDRFTFIVESADKRRIKKIKTLLAPIENGEDTLEE